MTRKDYVAVSNLVKAEKSVNRDNPGIVRALDNLAMSLADVMARDNERFDRGRFYTACGIVQ